MNLIVITSDTDYIYIDFNDVAIEWMDAKVRRSMARSVCRIVEDKGVEVIWSDGGRTILKHQYIGSINGDTNISSNLILRDKLRELM